MVPPEFLGGAETDDFVFGGPRDPLLQAKTGKRRLDHLGGSLEMDEKTLVVLHCFILIWWARIFASLMIHAKVLHVPAHK
jgi:hypothetical protein